MIPQRERRAGRSSPEAVESRSSMANRRACSRNIKLLKLSKCHLGSLLLYVAPMQLEATQQSPMSLNVVIITSMLSRQQKTKNDTTEGAGNIFGGSRLPLHLLSSFAPRRQNAQHSPHCKPSLSEQSWKYIFRKPNLNSRFKSIIPHFIMLAKDFYRTHVYMGSQ